MAVVKVLRSEDRHWRVEFQENGRVRVYDHGFLMAVCWRYELRGRLAALGVDVDQLIED